MQYVPPAPVSPALAGLTFLCLELRVHDGDIERSDARRVIVARQCRVRTVRAGENVVESTDRLRRRGTALIYRSGAKVREIVFVQQRGSKADRIVARAREPREGSHRKR